MRRCAASASASLETRGGQEGRRAQHWGSQAGAAAQQAAHAGACCMAHAACLGVPPTNRWAVCENRATAAQTQATTSSCAPEQQVGGRARLRGQRLVQRTQQLRHAAHTRHATEHRGVALQRVLRQQHAGGGGAGVVRAPGCNKQQMSPQQAPVCTTAALRFLQGPQPLHRSPSRSNSWSPLGSPQSGWQTAASQRGSPAQCSPAHPAAWAPAGLQSRGGPGGRRAGSGWVRQLGMRRGLTERVRHAAQSLAQRARRTVYSGGRASPWEPQADCLPVRRELQ